jgi:hypothetical protein
MGEIIKLSLGDIEEILKRYAGDHYNLGLINLGDVAADLDRTAEAYGADRHRPRRSLGCGQRAAARRCPGAYRHGRGGPHRPPDGDIPEEDGDVVVNRRPDFTIEMLGRNAFRIIRRNRVAFECDGPTLSILLRDVTHKQRRRLFTQALARLREKAVQS